MFGRYFYRPNEITMNSLLQTMVILASVYGEARSQVFKCQENRFALDFSSSSEPATSPSKVQVPQNELTVCFWMKVAQGSRDMTVFSLKGSNGLQIFSMLMKNSSSVTVQIGSSKKILKSHQLTGNVVSICLTWTNNDGRCRLYVNSALADMVTGFSKDYVIKPGDQVYLGGKLGQFVGLISHFNMWSYVLPTQVIAILGQRCGVERGDVIPWESFKVNSGVHVDICSEQAPQWNRAGLVHHWTLNGPDTNVRLNYSAVYLEGRYSTSKSLFLDSTEAYATLKPGINLNGNFTFSFWMKYISDEPRNATIVNNHDEFILKILKNSLIVQRSHYIDKSGNITKVSVLETTEDLINGSGSTWQHVALVWQEDTTSYHVRLYVDGRLIHKGKANRTQNWVTPISDQWYLGRTYASWDYGYFLGYLSDFMVFKRALSDNDIATLMAVGSSVYQTFWKPVYSSSSSPQVTQSSVETWPDIGKCTKTRPYQPADCMGALLIGKDKVNFTHESVTVQLPCDQETNGGGWLIIGTRTNNNEYFDQTIQNYTDGFWENEKNFWLGGTIVASMTEESHQLLAEVHPSKGNLARTLCNSFRMESPNTVIGGCSGSNIPLTSLADFKNLFLNTSFDKVELKIRPFKDLPNDFTLFLGSSRSFHTNVRLRNLTELTSFTICLWTKVSKHHSGTLFSLVSDDLKCNLAISSPVQLQISCTNVSALINCNLFDDKWHHICITWTGSLSHISVYIGGKRIKQSTGHKSHVFSKAGILNIGRHQDTLSDSSIQTSKDFIGQICHMHLWDFVKDESFIEAISKGPGVESGNMLMWALIRAWVPVNVQVLYPSSCTLQETYRWTFKSNNGSFQVDDKMNASAHIEGGIIEPDESIIFNKQGSITSSYVKNQTLGIAMSFWIKQKVFISSILGDNNMYYDQLKTWLSPIISHHALWVRCYSSKLHGYYASSFHNQCDFKGPTITLIKVKGFIFGGMIDQSWGGSSGFLPSTNAFLFTLNNPHQLPPTKFPIKQDQTQFAAHTNQFVGPSFGFNDLTVYEDVSGRIACWSNLGTSYNVTIVEGTNVFTGCSVFYPDEIEVFLYDLPATKVQDKPSTSFINNSNVFCSSSKALDQFIQWDFDKLETITHISLQGDPTQGYVTAFLVNYSSISTRYSWRILPRVYVSRSKWVKTVHSFLPPIQAYSVKITPTKWHKQICMIVNIFKTTKECAEAFGMESGAIADKKITASSSFSTYKPDYAKEFRWPHRGRLNSKKGAKAWHPAFMKIGYWFQVDLGNVSALRCLALQGRPNKIHYVRAFQFAYSLDGNTWKYMQTKYNNKTFQGIENQLDEVITVMPRSVMVRFVRIYPVKCSKYCALRIEIYGNQTGIEDNMEGLEFAFRQGSNSFIYSTSSKTWKVENRAPLQQWTHVTITWSPANGIKVYYNGTLKEQSSFSNAVTKVTNQVPIALTMAEGVGTTPVKIGNLKVWNQEIDQRMVFKDYESINCDFEQDMCLDRFEISSKQKFSWERSLYCMSTKKIGPCEDDTSLTGYCLSLKSLPVYRGQSSTFTSPLLHSAISCIFFDYQISGNTTGRINVNIIELSGKKTLLWRTSGNLGNVWKEGRIPLNRVHSFKIEFEGILANDPGEHLSIDNITFSVQTCLLTPPNATSNTSVIKTKIINHIPTYMKFLNDIMTAQNQQTSWTPCYTSRDHGWNITLFKKLCQSKGPTIALVRSRNNIYGGFTEDSLIQECPNEEMSSLDFDGQKSFSIVNLTRDISSFTISLWMQTSSLSSMVLLSTTPEQLVIQYQANTLNITLFSQSVSVPCALSDYKWHHIFVQWKHFNQNLTIYINGVFMKKTSFSINKVLRKGTFFLLGKGSSNKEYYMGKLDGANIWSSEVDEGLARILSQGYRHVYHGNVITWKDFKAGIRETTTVVPSSCVWNTSERDYDLFFPSAVVGYVAINSAWIRDLHQFTMVWWMKTDTYKDLYILSYMNDACTHKNNFGISFTWNETTSKWMFVLDFTRNCTSPYKYQERLLIQTQINDGFWHHVAVTWYDVNLRVDVTVDGLLEGSIPFKKDSLNKYIESIPKDGKVILGQTPKDNNPNGDLGSNLIFIGRLTDFNIIDVFLSQEALRVLSLRWGSITGNLLSWADARHHVIGTLQTYSPSSCRRETYRPDTRAFLFILNNSSSTVAKISSKHVEVSTSLQESHGLVYGESPHDLIIGVNGSMKTAVYRGNVSYELLDHLPRARLTVDDIEVLYKTDSLCSSRCSYHYSCDEINGRCICNTADTSFGLCDIEQKYPKIQYFWPLDHPNNIKNLKSSTWGVVKGDVTYISGVNMGALKIDVGSKVVLERLNTSCLKATCEITVSLWLKYWLTNSTQNQTFLDINGLLTLYQPKGNVMEMAANVNSNHDRFIQNIFYSPAGIWNHYTIVISKMESIIYKNKQEVKNIKRNFTDLSESSKNDPLNGLITLSCGGTQAEFDDLVISNTVLLQSHINDIMTSYTDKTIVPVGFSAKLSDETWHNSLSRQDSQLYLDFVERIKSNISRFYADNSITIHSITVDTLREEGGNVIGEFTIRYYPWSNKHVTLLSESIASTSMMGRLTLKDLQITPVLVPNKPSIVQTIKQSNTIKTTWNAPMMDSKTSSYFQGYNVYYLKQGEVNWTKFVVEGMQTQVIFKDPIPYTILRIWVTAFTIKGEGLPSNEVTLSGAIGAPTGIPNITSAYNTSSTSIFVKWAKPQDNSTITGYEVSIFRNDSQVKPLRSLLTNCTQATLLGLDVYTAYVIKIAAFNTIGIGPQSKPVICITDEEVPTGSPHNITLPSVASRQVHLAWKPIPISQRNGLLLGYNITYYLLNYSNAQVPSYATTNNSQITLTNLRPYSTYRIQITGYNTKGQGPGLKSPYIIKTSEAAPSGSPVITEAISQGSTSILIKSWETIPKPKLNGILRYYIVQYQVVNTTLTYIKNITSSFSRRKRRAISSPHIILDGLQKFTNYSIKIAGGTVGQGPYSPGFVVSTGEDVPGAVISLQATNDSSTSIRVTWQPPTNPNGIILGYKVNYSDGADSLGSIDTKLTSYILKGLVNYTLYNIHVTCYTIKGEGNVSTVTCRTDESVPTGPPRSPAAFPVSLTSIEVKWRPVAISQRRGIITKYLVMLFNSSGLMILRREVSSDHDKIVLHGLQKQSNYSVKISAFTRKGQGPFSKLIYTSTNNEAPKFVPSKVKAQLNGTNRILVQWSSIAQGQLRGYRVLYMGINHPFAGERNISVDHWTQEVILKDLYYYTRYIIKVSAYTAFEGNFSKPVYVTTGESVPTHPPTKVVVASRGSTNVSVFWDLIPIGHRNGRIISYRVEYRRTGSNESYTQETDQFSTRLTALKKNTRYDVIISGATSAGYGNKSFHSVTTDEDVPSETPQNLTAQNWTSLYTIPVSWKPVAANHMHGKLTGYHLTYLAVKRGDKEVYDDNISIVSLSPNQTSYTIMGLQPLSVYRITVVASTRKGAGPKATTFGETCRCTRTLTTSWSEYSPYVNITTGLIIPALVANMTSYCCGHCKDHGHSTVNFRFDGNGTSAKKSSLGELVQSIDGHSDFSFPIYGHYDQSLYKGGLGFSPLILSPGVAFIVYKKDTVKLRENMFNAIIGCWPVLAVPIVMCYIAGFIIWVLDSRLNPQHYPQSFHKGIQNGFWWAFVSMTTVGYGDKTPIGHGSRLFAVIWTLCGIIIISVCTSTVTTSLTEVTINNKQMLYGSKVAALHNSPEFWLGKRKNAKVNERREYHTLLELINALEDKEVDGILVDTYAAGSRSDLFNRPSLRIAKVLDYKMAYGLVTAGYAIQLRQCFHEYLTAFAADIYHNISNNVRMIEYKQDPPDQIITDGLFNTKAEQFNDSVKFTGCVLCLFLIFGITFDWIRRVRTRAPIEGQAVLHDISKKKEIMKDIVNTFKDNMERTSRELIKKHSLELWKARKLRSRKLKKLDTPSEESFIMQRLSSKSDSI